MIPLRLTKSLTVESFRFPSGGFFPQMTVTESLDTGASVPRGRLNKQGTLEKVVGLFPRIKDRRNQFAGSLSGGEQQVLAIARGLMANPILLVLDEPSLGLAPRLRSGNVRGYSWDQ